MPKLNVISAKRMMKALKRLGFQLLRTRGSHHFFWNPETGKSTVIPLHGNEDLGIGLLKEILRDIDVSVEEFEKLRK